MIDTTQYLPVRRRKYSLNGLDSGEFPVPSDDKAGALRYTPDVVCYLNRKSVGVKNLLLVLLLLVIVVPVGAQDDDLSDTLETEMASLETATRQIRELDGVAVVRAFPTREETIEYLRDSLDEQLPVDEAGRYHDFYVALGLLDPDTDLREVYLTLLGAQVAGYYDSDTKIMNVIPLSGAMSDELSLTEQIIYVHEFTHALQDQFFELNGLLESDDVADNPDRTLATISLVEGDATAVMNVYTQEVVSRNPLAAFQLLGEGLQAGNLTLPPGTPPILARELMFPYDGGMVFVTALFQQNDDWDTVNAAYTNPPTTTEQILHPPKYLAGEGAVEVALDDASATLGEGWSQVWNTTLGEWYLREHLAVELPRAEASDAAAGWGGDRFQVYRQADDGALAWRLRLVWDTPAEQAEFVQAYAQFGEARYGAAASADCWTDAGSALCLNVAGDAVVIAQGPTLEAASRLAE